MSIIAYGLIISLIAILLSSIKIVPQQEAWIIERFGKFRTLLQPGLSLVIPIADRVAYKHDLREQAIEVTPQAAISNDNVSLSIDGILYVRIIDAVAASYGVSNPYYAISQLAQTTMRSEIGKLPLDRTFEERELLNFAIVNILNQAAASWGIQCLRYEIKDIHPPQSVLRAMELQVAAERQKRAQILESEGMKQSKINNAEAQKAEVVLASEAKYVEISNRTKAEAEAIARIAAATAQSIEVVAEAIKLSGGEQAVAMKLGENYIKAFSELAKKNNTLIIPAAVDNPGAMIAQALAIFKNIPN